MTTTLEPTRRTRQRPTHRIRGLRYLLELWVLLAIVRFRLTRRGFEPTIRWATDVRGERDPGAPGALDIAELAKTQAQRVFRWHPVANKCLEQSLLLCRFVARRGLKAEIIMAVRKYPFESHAWTVLGDVELTDPPERHPEAFKEIARY